MPAADAAGRISATQSRKAAAAGRAVARHNPRARKSCLFMPAIMVGQGKQNDDALKCEVEPVRDLPEAPAGLVDGPLAVDPVTREDHHAADGVGDGHERFVVFVGVELGMHFGESPPRERGDDRVAGQPELAKFRVMMQVHAGLGVIQVEERAIWQGLTPQEFVVPPERGAVFVRVFPFPERRIGPEVERCIDKHTFEPLLKKLLHVNDREPHF